MSDTFIAKIMRYKVMKLSYVNCTIIEKENSHTENIIFVDATQVKGSIKILFPSRKSRSTLLYKDSYTVALN